MAHAPTNSTTAHEMHLRRVRRMSTAGNGVTAVIGLSWGGFFALHGNWPVVALDAVAVALSVGGMLLARQGRQRLATLLYMAVVYALLCVTALLIDVPSAAVPRSMHLFLLPLAACSCLMLRDEPAPIRHGIPLLCLATFALFHSRWLPVATAYALPDSIRSVGQWIDIALALMCLYVGVLMIMSDVAERSGAEQALRNALIRGELLLHYQPQVDSDGRVIGAEALVRWKHPERGLVGPNEFIPLAERSGLMLPLGDWVLRSACQQLARWQANPALRDLPVAVNVSALQFCEADFVERVLAIVDETGARTALLKLELTESVLAEDLDDIVRKMSALRERGIRFSLDDFGTGFSSLSYLRKLPLDQLKIDQSFVRNILRSSEDASIAKTVVELGHSLKLDVIAEGVETLEHRSLLAGIGCRSYQGFFFSRPLTSASFEEFVAGAAGAVGAAGAPADAHANGDAAVPSKETALA